MVTIIIVASAIVLTLAYVALLRQEAIVDPDQLLQPRAAPLTMSVQIICGDCAGEGIRPNRTCLDWHGQCTQCGGRSYVLASIVAANSAHLRAERLKEAQAGSGFGRVIPFETPSSRTTRPDKIAV